MKQPRMMENLPFRLLKPMEKELSCGVASTSDETVASARLCRDVQGPEVRVQIK